MRNKRAPKRYILPDPKFGSELVTKFVNKMMYDGKKSVGYFIFYKALEIVEQKAEMEEGETGLDVFQRALNNVMPTVEVRSRRVGGSTFQIPTEVRAERRTALGIRWMIEFTRKRGERTMAERLGNEIVAAAKGEGGSVKKKEDVHRMAEANKAFSHFRF
jgi:small subunit ribosomal protein S7